MAPELSLWGIFTEVFGDVVINVAIEDEFSFHG